MAKDLRQFLETARKAGPEFYAEARRPLKPRYEVGVLQHKLAKEGRFPVVYCPEIEGSRLPLVTNVFGRYELLGLALDISPQRLKTAGKGEILKEYVSRQGKLNPTREVPAAQAPVREVVLQGKDVDLDILPINLHAPLNPERYVTIGMTVCKDPDSGIPNVGIYRQQVMGKDRIACTIIPTHHGDHIARRYAELGRPMEVVTFIGHHPALAMAASDLRSTERKEYEFMAALLGETLEVTRGLTVDLPIPALAEIAIEGVIDPAKMDKDGPFSEAAGYYGEARPCYVMQVTAITMRQDAIYHDLHPTHQEHMTVMLLSREYRIHEAVADAVPSVKAVHIGPEGQPGKGLIQVAIEKNAEDEGRLAGLAALRSDFAKIAVVVDEDVDIYDQGEILWAIATRIREDLVISTNPQMPAPQVEAAKSDSSGLDLQSRYTRILLDATKPLEGPFPTRVTHPKEVWESIRAEDYLK